MIDPVTVLVGAPADSSPALVAPTTETVAVIGRVTTGNETIERVLDELPAVLLLDQRIGGPDARAVCRRVREWAPATRVLSVVERDDEQAYTTLVAGAAGAVLLSDDTAGVGRAVVGLDRGESVLLPRMAGRLLHDLDAWAGRSADPIHPPPTLTATEREVLVRRSERAEPEAIAAAHGVTPHLVNLHAGFAVAKLHRYVIVSERIAADG